MKASTYIDTVAKASPALRSMFCQTLKELAERKAFLNALEMGDKNATKALHYEQTCDSLKTGGILAMGMGFVIPFGACILSALHDKYHVRNFSGGDMALFSFYILIPLGGVIHLIAWIVGRFHDRKMPNVTSLDNFSKHVGALLGLGKDGWQVVTSAYFSEAGLAAEVERLTKELAETLEDTEASHARIDDQNDARYKFH